MATEEAMLAVDVFAGCSRWEKLTVLEEESRVSARPGEGLLGGANGAIGVM